MSDATRHLTLANGLHLTLRHAPRLKRAAAALRVHAGSHDAAPQWPGLAHFLEHLFFLGNTRFPAEDGLMRYVQNLGGQVNASTRERTTDFFFEVPPNALSGGLERLCQMLAEPDLSLARQRREREVIHAEFIAWSRNPQAQQQFALLQSLSARHPLSGFHAGNRYSLPLLNSNFQQALRQFHQDFYQGSQITLSLVGPQPLAQLESLGRRFTALFPAGLVPIRSAPPALLNEPLRAPPAAHDLLFAHDGLPAGAEQALELLLSLLGDSRPGGWLAELRRRNWLLDCKAEPLYAHAGQLLWHIRLQLAEHASYAEAIALLHGWLGFLRQQSGAELNAAWAALQQRREQAASALELARRDSAGQPFQALDEQALQAFSALLDDLPQSGAGDWQLPPAEALLCSHAGAASAALPACLSLDDSLPPARQFAAVYLRWRIASPMRARFKPVLDHALRPLLERAERASLQLGFSASGEYWQLHAEGQPLGVTQLLKEALTLLRTPPAESWQAASVTEPALIPIRALLKALPDALWPAHAQPQPACTLDQSLLEALWQHARWQALALGFTPSVQGTLGAALQELMGQPETTPATPLIAGRQWRALATPGSEPALLLFCPLPEHLQACGRLLAQLLQGPVYQRLRVELQLGYAVFSAFRQIEGVSGLLFGVQSPHVSQAQILQHLLTLLQQGIELDTNARQQLAEQFNEAAMSNAQVADWAWQANMAKHNSDLSDLRWSILNTGQADLDALLQQLISARHGWLVLANSAAPDASWQ